MQNKTAPRRISIGIALTQLASLLAAIGWLACGGTAVAESNATGLLGIYYDNLDFTAPRVARTEAVNFDWGLDAPAPGVGAETFSVRWTGKVVPRCTDSYQFFTVSDDGVRLWIDGRLIVNEWNDHGPTEHYGNFFMEAGQSYNVVLEMYENGGGATARLLWQSGCQPKEPIPASQLLPARLEYPTPNRPTFSLNFTDVSGTPAGTALFGQAAVDAGWLKLTTPDTAFGIFHIHNFSGSQPVHGFEAKFTAALFGSTCCSGGASPADGFSFNLVPAASVLANPGYNEPGEEGLAEGLAVNFDTWDNGGGEGPAVEVKWRGQVIARQPFQASQSPAGIPTALAAAREVLIDLASDGRLTVSYGGMRVLSSVQTPYTPLIIGAPTWVIGARNGGANDNHWIRDLQIVVNRAKIPELFNTGVYDLGQPLTDNVSDPHYVMPSPGGPTTVPFIVTAAGGFPIGPWLPDNTVSAWIAPSTTTLAPQDFEIRYQTSFNLRGLNPAGAVIHGWVAADNQLGDILINGQGTHQATPLAALGGEPFTSWQAFVIESGFRPGSNTLTFVTRNGTGGDNPTGLRVEMCGWATPSPLLHLNIASERLSTTIQWGSLPHEQYFLEHADNLSGPWEAGAAFRPNAYQAQVFEDYHRIPRDPFRFYRAVSPSQFAAAPLSPTVSGSHWQATVSWVPAAGASGYSVERWSQVDPNCCRASSPQLPPNATSWVDSNYWIEGTYTFRVTAFYPNGTYGAVDVSWVRPTPQDPSGFAAVRIGATTVQLTWQPVPGVTRYLLFGPGVTGSEPVSGTTLTVAGVPTGLQTWTIFSLYEPGGVFTTGVQTSVVVTGPAVLSGWVDMHAHLMGHLGFGKKLVHGAPDIGSLIPAGGTPVGNACNASDYRATTMEEALGNCNSTHGGWGFGNTCGNYIRAITLRHALDDEFAHNLNYDPFGGGNLHGDHRHEGVESNFLYWPHQTSKSHQQMWWEWIQRAYQPGGLRVMVALTVNSELLAEILDGNEPRDDKGSADLQIDEIKTFVSGHTNFMEIAYTAADLRRIVSGDRLAVIIGMEVDNIGNFNKLGVTATEATVRAEIQRLHGKGVRYAFPIHLVDNKFGGTAVYDDLFNFANKYSTSLRVGRIELQPGNLFAIQTSSDPLITYRLGSGLDGAGNLGIMGLLGVASGIPYPPAFHIINCPTATLGCSDTFRLVTGLLAPDPRYAIYAATPAGHVNAQGLTGLGKFAVKEMMRLGMLIDIDHMSQKSVDDTLDLAENVGGTLRPGYGQYPVNIGHNGIRVQGGNERHASTTTARRVAALGGLFGVGTADSDQHNTDAPSFIASFTNVWARMGNKAVAIGTDVNGQERLPRASAGLDSTAFYSAFPQCTTATTTGIRTWDYTKEGVAHYGLMADFMEDVRTRDGGVHANLMQSAEYFARMWEAAEAQSRIAP